jgi:hypothetical protein
LSGQEPPQAITKGSQGSWLTEGFLRVLGGEGFLPDHTGRRSLGGDFGVRWTGTIRPPVSGAYRLGVLGTMRAELVVDDSVVVRTTYPQRDDEFADPRLAES